MISNVLTIFAGVFIANIYFLFAYYHFKRGEKGWAVYLVTLASSFLIMSFLGSKP